MNRLTTTDIWSLLAVAVLTAFAAFLAAAETGLTRISRARAMHLHEEQRRGSTQLLALVENPARFLNLVLLLVLVVQFFATALFTSVTSRCARPSRPLRAPRPGTARGPSWSC